MLVLNTLLLGENILLLCDLSDSLGDPLAHEFRMHVDKRFINLNLVLLEYFFKTLHLLLFSSLQLFLPQLLQFRVHLSCKTLLLLLEILQEIVEYLELRVLILLRFLLWSQFRFLRSLIVSNLVFFLVVDRSVFGFKELNLSFRL